MSKFTSISKIIKGGEKMRTFGLVLALVCLVGGSAIAATGTIDLYSGWNCVSLPNVPLNPDTVNFFSSTLTAAKALNPQYSLDQSISRFESAWGSDVYYIAGDPTFGNMLLGDGYWVLYPGEGANNTITYEGVDSGVPTGTTKTDMWISMPGNQYDGNDVDRNSDGVLDGGGWNFFGNPYAESVSATNISFTDGTEVKTWSQAITAKWVGETAQGFEGQWAASINVSPIFPLAGEAGDLAVARGYYIETFKDNLAMIIKAPTTAP